MAQTVIAKLGSAAAYQPVLSAIEDKNDQAIMTLSLAASFGIDPLMAEHSPGSSLSGYQCYAVDVEKIGLSRDDAWSGRAFRQCLTLHVRTPTYWCVAGRCLCGVALGYRKRICSCALRDRENRMDVGRCDPTAISCIGIFGGCVLSWNGDRIQFISIRGESMAFAEITISRSDIRALPAKEPAS